MTESAADALKRIAYLRGLSPEASTALAKLCQIRRLPRGLSAFLEGDEPSGIFLILEGRMKLVRSSEDGREQVLHEEGPGATLAEVPAFDGEPCLASAVAVQDSVLLFVPRLGLLEAIDRTPGSCREVIRVLASRVRKFAALVADLSLHAVKQRVARYLLREADSAGERSFELATRDHIAAHLGTVREQVSRALSELKRAGAIQLRGRRIRILDERALRSRAGRTLG